MKDKIDIENHEQDVDLILLARMARRRKETPVPDIDKEWSKFSARHQVEPHRKPVARRHEYRLMVSALLGAAAMLLCVLVFDYLNQHYALFSSHEPYVALSYVPDVQQVVLEKEDEQLNLSGKDSISFIPVSRPLAKARKAEPVVAAQHDALLEGVHMQRLSTPRGMAFKVVLSDASEVWLNAESSIEFPATFVGRERQVKLKGEAYFKVAPNKHFPFIVETEQMKVRVLGTEFNFEAYQNESPAVSLVNGAVEVMPSVADSVAVRLVPGQKASYDAAGEVQVEAADIYAVQQWVNGFFYFDNKSLIEILRSLGRWYNYGVIFNSTDHMHTRLHFSIDRNEDIESAILSLKRFMGINIILEDNNIIVLE